MNDDKPGFLTRFAMAFAVFFQVLFNATFAGRIRQLGAPTDHGTPAAGPTSPQPPAPASSAPKSVSEPAPKPQAIAEAEPETAPTAETKAGLVEHDPTAALQLLALLQREGRLIDFLFEDISGFGDADVGAAARVVHSGCKKVIEEHVKLRPVREEEEGAQVTLAADFSASEVRLTGNVTGSGPFRGTLSHRGWRADGVALPQLSASHNAQVVAPAEVEL